MTSEDRAMAVGHSVDPAGWQWEFDELMGRIASRFGRVEPRRTTRAYVTGLLSGVERKNCWNLAEHAGHRGPEAMQRLLRIACWDADQVRDDVRDYVHDRLGHPDGVLIVDETGFVKKGTASAGVQRQYTGTAGRIENSQVGVFLAYASAKGRALIDRRLYLPAKTWLADSRRCQAAGVPDQAVFATKPALAGQMITAAVEAGIDAAWVTGDEVYGQDPRLHALIAGHGIGYVLAIAGNQRVRTSGSDGGAGRRWCAGLAPLQRRRRSQRATVLRLGLETDRSRWQRTPVAAGPAHDRDRRAGVLPVLFTHPGAAGHLGAHRWDALGDRGVVPGRQGPGRTGPLPSPRLDRLASPHHPGAARPGLPRRGGRRIPLRR
ncbi:IS701 family transposase [Sphaerisporangium sp. NPDC005289]|uniref:IS701 family transposase n=1 Tax=Sphaerisporangium sp. NPDC005289 TaxID=3155247 RepID=UPI0033BDC520